MSTTNNPFLAHIAVFDSTNWSSFSKDVQVFFQLEGIWGIVNGTTKKPTDADEAAKWTRSTERAYSMLYFLIGVDYCSLIVDVATSVDAWKLLKDEYQKDSSVLRLALCNQLYSIRHDPKQPVSVYIEASRTVARQLKGIGHAGLDADLGDLILLCLHPSFATIRLTLSNCTPSPKLPSLIASIKAFGLEEKLLESVAESIKKEEEDKEDEGSRAMAAIMGRGSQKGARGEFDWGNSKETDGVCHCCGRSGHITRRCIADMPEDVKSKILASNTSAAIVEKEIIKIGGDYGVAYIASDDFDLDIISDESDCDLLTAASTASSSHSAPSSISSSSSNPVQLKGVCTDTLKKTRCGRRGDNRHK
ncbi:Retrovirus-related Pol polyprotein from transposon TNT 1-94 [Mycena venus]|uniref:Retrovirus-related Pol polyprotein from transposon TNT 1-94 n=1 Tax=Mycena venus TaxID=2733690 RepID=A0A8H6Y5B7_9AGAR|nr:Retrovirus-related Pol polyprotein from transposon TNT 1-94 [Mycena venus]